jgi:hypothetical protein
MDETKVRSINALSATEREELRKAISEINDSMTRAAAEKDLQRDIINALSDKIDLDKKIIRSIAKLFFNANFDEVSEEQRMIEEFYVLLNSTIPTV